MRFPAKITSSCIWVALPDSKLHWYASGGDGRSPGGGGEGRSVYGHVITKLGRLLHFHFLTHGAPLRARELRYKIGPFRVIPR